MSFQWMQRVTNFAMISPVAIVYYAFAGLLLFVISKGFYNRYFHPLRNFPGPFWGGITDFYLVYMIASVPTFGLDLHKKYGGDNPSASEKSANTLILRTCHSTISKLTIFQRSKTPTCSIPSKCRQTPVLWILDVRAYRGHVPIPQTSGSYGKEEDCCSVCRCQMPSILQLLHTDGLFLVLDDCHETISRIQNQ